MNITNCNEIEIYNPGFVQDFGYLIGINAESKSIDFYSENIADLFPLEESVLQKNIDDLECFSSIINSPQFHDADRNSKEDIKNSDKIEINGKEYHISVYKHKDTLFIELEKCLLGGLSNSSLLKGIKNLPSLKKGKDIWKALVKNICQITGYDRVMVYKFNSDGSGKVVAEEKLATMESYMHLHYPESDIPQQARALYLKNHKRILSDINALPVKIISQVKTVDLTYSGIRAISPIHIEYLKNGGISSSFSVSIIIDDELWGLVTCHSTQPKHIDLDNRILAEIATFIASNAYSSYQAKKTSRYETVLNKVCYDLKKELLKFTTIKDSLINNVENIRNVSETDGFAIIADNTVKAYGKVPNENIILRIYQWAVQNIEDKTYFDDSFYKKYHASLGLDKNCCGVSLAFINKQNGHLLIWFRQEFKDHISWAGKDKKEIETLNFYNEQKLVYSPRKSFQVFYEEISDKSHYWSSKDRLRINKIRDLVNHTMQEQLHNISRMNDELTKINEELNRINDELDSYSHTISHDLATPLTVMKLNVQMMARHNTDEYNIKKIQNVLSEIDNMSGMMSNVLKLSRLKYSEYIFEKVDPAEIIEKACTDAKLSYNENAAITVRNIYPVTGEKSLITQVFQNIITNAVKYSSQKESAEIIVDSSYDGTYILYTISDNGIGIPYQSKDEVFKVFQRMGNARSFLGSGVGLSIVKNIMRKLSGNVDFESVENQGTTFFLRFPAVKSA